MICTELLDLMNEGVVCEETDHGARYLTHCVYPSFDRVSVFVSRWGDGYRVTDGGGAVTSVLKHGRDDTALTNALKLVRQRFGVATSEGVIVAEADREWLSAAVLAVANASAAAAAIAVKQVAAAVENLLKDAIRERLKETVPEESIATDYEFVGESGKTWTLDFAVLGKRRVLIKAVSPHPNSINANHTAFGDLGREPDAVRFSVFDRPLSDEDAALLRQVALLVPVKSVGAGALREINRTRH